jgi:hypothetical protein
MDYNSTKIVLQVIAALVVILGGSFLTFKIARRRSNKVRQDNITVSGNNSKVLGGDDNSKIN